MDGVTGEEGISEVFARKYEHLYNGVSYEENDMCRLQNDIDAKITEECCNDRCGHHHSVNLELINQATSRLNAGKSDSEGCFFTDYIINAGQDLPINLYLLFTALLRHAASDAVIYDYTNTEKHSVVIRRFY